MRSSISVDQLAQFKKKAKRLKGKSPEKTLMQCQDTVAYIEGYRNWHELNDLVYDAKSSTASRTQSSVKSRPKPMLKFGQKLPERVDSVISEVELDLESSPHMMVLGQTRSGKTRTVQSFVSSFKKAFPGSIYFFADGKGSNDYDDLAKSLSTLPTSMPFGWGGTNNISAQLDEIEKIVDLRRKLFSETDTPVSSLVMYERKSGKVLPRILFVIDEFSTFSRENHFDETYKEEGTIPFRLHRLLTRGAIFGIHFCFVAQRPTTSDISASVQSNLTTKIIHKLAEKDAIYLDIPEAVDLNTGEFFISSPGIKITDDDMKQNGRPFLKAKTVWSGD